MGHSAVCCSGQIEALIAGSNMCIFPVNVGLQQRRKKRWTGRDREPDPDHPFNDTPWSASRYSSNQHVSSDLYTY